jgi:O-antigen/teichoic acid export membrane protein
VSGAPRVARNLSIVTLAQVIVLAATFAFTVAQARYLGPARFGELSLALSFSVMLGSLTDFGLGTRLARTVAQQPHRVGPALGSTLVVSVGLWAVAMPIALATTVVLGYGPILRACVLILVVGLLFAAAGNVLSAYYQGREEFRIRSIAPILKHLAIAGIGITVLAAGGGPVEVAAVVVFGGFLNLAIFAVALHRQRLGVPHLNVDSSSIRETFLGAAPIGMFWIFGTTYFNIDMLLLRQLSEPENVGWYAGAYRLFSVGGIIATLVSGVVLYPVFARLSLGAGEELRAAMARACRFLLLAGVFVVLVLLVLAEQIVTTVYSTGRFAATAEALRLLAPAVATQYVGSVFQFSLLAMGHEKRLLVMAAVLAVANPVVNLVAIPLWQQNGAALVTTATEIVVLAWLLLATPRWLRSAASPRALVRTAIAALPAAAALLVLRDQHVLVAIFVAGVAYVASALAIHVLPEEDLQLLRAVVNSRWRPEAATPLVRRTAEDQRRI